MDWVSKARRSGGLKLDLDRFKDEVNVFLREAKMGAEDYIVHVKEMRAAAEKAPEEDDAGEDEDEDEDEGDEEKQK
jgi:hypothetical protein